MSTNSFQVDNTAVVTIAEGNGNRESIQIINHGTARVYISDNANVTSAGVNGSTLDAGEGASFSGRPATFARYAIAAAAAAQRVEVMDDL